MKYPNNLILISILLLLTSLSHAQSVQIKGRVSILNSTDKNKTIEYVSDVNINTVFSRPVTSDYKGRFNARLNKVKVDQPILFIIEKEGYEVIDLNNLQYVLLDKKDRLRVFLAKKGYLKKRRNDILKTTKKAIANEKERLLDLLALKGSGTQENIRDFENRFGQKIYAAYVAEELVIQHNEYLEEKLPYFSYELAAVNLDFASEMYRTAFASYQKGKLEKAIADLDEDKMNRDIESILSSFDQVKNKPEELKRMESVRSLRIEQIKNSYVLKIIALQQSFRGQEANLLIDRLEKINDIIPSHKHTTLIEKLKLPKNEAQENVNALLENETRSNRNRSRKDKISRIFAEKENQNNAEKMIMEVEQIEPAPTSNSDIDRSFDSRTLADATIEDFENTLFTSKNATIELGNLLRKEQKPVYTSQNGKPVIVQKETVVAQPTRPHVISKPAYMDPVENNAGNYIPVETIKKTKPTSQPARPVYKPIPKPKAKPVYKRFSVTQRTSLRRSPNSKAKVLKRLAVGTKVKVIKKVDRYWSKVILNGRQGYVKTRLLK